MGLAATTLDVGFHVPYARLENSDTAVPNNMSAVLAKYHVRPMASISDLFKVREHFLCTFAELGHYPQRGHSKYWGATSNIEMEQDVSWPDGQGKRVFVYLEPQTRNFDKVLQTITALGHRAVVRAPGLSDKLCRQFANLRTIISSKPFRIDKLLPDCDLAIGNAGHGMTAGMLLAGIPLLLFSTHLDRFLLTSRVTAMGAAITVNNEAPPPDYATILGKLLNEPGYRENARHFAKKYAGYNQAEQQENIVTRIEEIAARRQ